MTDHIRSVPALMDEPPITLYPTLACMLRNVNHALALQQLKFLMLQTAKSKKYDSHFIDGKWWVYNTYQQWKDDHFPWLSTSAIRDAFKALEDLGIVLSRQDVGNAFDKTKWYTIDFDQYSTEHTNFVASMDSESVASNEQDLSDDHNTETTITETTDSLAQTASGKSSSDGGHSKHCNCTKCQRERNREVAEHVMYPNKDFDSGHDSGNYNDDAYCCMCGNDDAIGYVELEYGTVVCGYHYSYLQTLERDDDSGHDSSLAQSQLEAHKIADNCINNINGKFCDLSEMNDMVCLECEYQNEVPAIVDCVDVLTCEGSSSVWCGSCTKSRNTEVATNVAGVHLVTCSCDECCDKSDMSKCAGCKRYMCPHFRFTCSDCKQLTPNESQHHIEFNLCKECIGNHPEYYAPGIVADLAAQPTMSELDLQKQILIPAKQGASNWTRDAVGNADAMQVQAKTPPPPETPASCTDAIVPDLSAEQDTIVVETPKLLKTAKAKKRKKKEVHPLYDEMVSEIETAFNLKRKDMGSDDFGRIGKEANALLGKGAKPFMVKHLHAWLNKKFNTTFGYNTLSKWYAPFRADSNIPDDIPGKEEPAPQPESDGAEIVEGSKEDVLKILADLTEQMSMSQFGDENYEQPTTD